MKLNSAVSKRDLFIFQYYRIIHGIRIAAAFILAVCITDYFHIPESSWILISLVVVIVPISYLGNVTQRALHRISGTLIGASSGILAIILTQYVSFLAMVLWCGIVMFFSAYWARGKRPYVALLIGITLSVTIGAGNTNIEVAVLRGIDVIAGCTMALLCCLVFPQRAFIHWRLRSNRTLKNLALLYHISSSQNMIDPPDLKTLQQYILKDMTTLGSLSAPSARETRLNPQLLDAIQIQMRNTLYTMELLTNSYWDDRRSHFAMVSADSLRECHHKTEAAILELADFMVNASVVNDMPPWEMDAVIDEISALCQQSNVQQEASIYGYFWLNMRLINEIKQLKRLFVYALNLSRNSGDVQK